MAANDLRGINRNTAQHWGARQARAYYAGLLQCFEMLAENPTLGIARPDVLEGYRSFEVQKNNLTYPVNPLPRPFPLRKGEGRRSLPLTKGEI
ncbi:MAG: type II toxin-antitoxin system RelE/ParE family toxin [Gammaproteobacteria bacterium]|nr:type II toxin-antitoxin system RelE/ParE family toxin [Gammaproteobacteria bacterium]